MNHSIPTTHHLYEGPGRSIGKDEDGSSRCTRAPHVDKVEAGTDRRRALWTSGTVQCPGSGTQGQAHRLSKAEERHQTSTPMPKSSASSSMAAGAWGTASSSPRTTSGAANAASIALSVLSGSTARQQFVIESASSRRSFRQTSGSTSGGVTCENSPHKRMNRNR